MEQPIHSIGDLFTQLGLSAASVDIDAFIDLHKPIDRRQKIHELPFFNRSQQQFLLEAIEEDADWAEVIGTLDTLLRQDADIRPS